MKKLSERQSRFLNDYAMDDRPMKALFEDHGILPRELEAWREEEIFLDELRVVERFIAFEREADVRRGARDYVRRSRAGLNGKVRLFPASVARAGRELVNLARRADGTFPAHGASVRTFCQANPIHPAYASEAPQLLARMEAMNEREVARGRRRKGVTGSGGDKSRGAISFSWGGYERG